MKHVTKKLFSLALLVSTFAVAKDVTNRSVLIQAHQGRLVSNGLVAEANHCCDNGESYARVSGGVQYSRSTDAKRIAKYFFGTEEKVLFGGNEKGAINPVNFFLHEGHESTLTLKPKLCTVSGEVRAHIGLGEFLEGLSFSASLPFVRAKLKLNLDQSATNPNDIAVDGGNLGTGTDLANMPYTDPIAALEGKGTGSAMVDATLKYGKIVNSQDDFRIADVRLALNYNLIDKENGQLTLGVLGIINGDKKSKYAEYLNMPTIGLGGRHALGGRVEGSLRLWENHENELAAHLRADIAYAFESTVRRSFDIKNHGPMSRYLVVAKHTDENTVTKITNAVNITSLEAKIGKFCVYDATLMLSWTHNAWEMNLGYTLAGTSKEKLSKFVSSMEENYVTFVPGAGTNAVGTDHTSYSADIQYTGKDAAGVNAVSTPLTAATWKAATLTTASLNTDYALQGNTMSHTIFGSVGYNWDSNEWMPSVSAVGAYTLGNDNDVVRNFSVGFVGGICF